MLITLPPQTATCMEYGRKMKVRLCSSRQILEPCTVGSFAYRLDPYVGCEHNCRYCYIMNQTETGECKEIAVYEDLADELSRELSGLEPQTIYMGMNTDPYQPCEAVHQQTRQVLELFTRSGFSVCILTKSDLVVRDIDLVTNMTGSSVGVSIAFQDEHVRQLFEGETPPNQRRIAALKKLKRAGIETYALIDPVMPFITDVPALIRAVAPHADTIWIYGLHMKKPEDQNWRNVKRILDRHFPHLTDKYLRIAFSNTDPFWSALRLNLEQLQAEKKFNLKIEL